MHIADGILPDYVAIAGYAGTGLVTWISLRKIHQMPTPEAEIPKASLLTAAFFVASFFAPTGSVSCFVKLFAAASIIFF